MRFGDPSLGRRARRGAHCSSERDPAGNNVSSRYQSGPAIPALPRGSCPAAHCEPLHDAVHELRQPASSLALLLSILERRMCDPALVPTLRAAQGAVAKLADLLPGLRGDWLCAEAGDYGAASAEFAGVQAELWPAATEPAPAAGDAHRQAAGLVLLVEDHADVADALATLLRDAGHRVHIATAADEAIALLASAENVSAVISDLGLPGGRDGLAVLRYAREQRPGAARVLITGARHPELMRTAHRDGVRLLHKPPRAAELIAALAAEASDR